MDEVVDLGADQVEVGEEGFGGDVADLGEVAEGGGFGGEGGGVVDEAAAKGFDGDWLGGGIGDHADELAGA